MGEMSQRVLGLPWEPLLVGCARKTRKARCDLQEQNINNFKVESFHCLQKSVCHPWCNINICISVCTKRKILDYSEMVNIEETLFVRSDDITLHNPAIKYPGIIGMTCTADNILLCTQFRNIHFLKVDVP